MVNALAEAAKLFSKLPEQEVPEKTSGYEGFYMLAKQSGNIGMVEAEYIIRDHSMEKFQKRKETFAKIVEEQNATYDIPRIECQIYDEYFNMYEVLKEDMTSVEVAIEAYRQCGIDQTSNLLEGEQMVVLLHLKVFQHRTYLQERRIYMDNMNLLH